MMDGLTTPADDGHDEGPIHRLGACDSLSEQEKRWRRAAPFRFRAPRSSLNACPGVLRARMAVTLTGIPRGDQHRAPSFGKTPRLPFPGRGAWNTVCMCEWRQGAKKGGICTPHFRAVEGIRDQVAGRMDTVNKEKLVW